MNWVKARGSCTIRSTFKALRERVKADVDEFNRLEEADRGCIFAADERGRDFFSVRSTGNGAVRFQANHTCIAVAGTAQDNGFSVTLRWDDESDTCHLLVDGQPLELWQISKRALTPLLFD
ncbi:MAG: hypothetical protein OXI73_07120 [Rhodospirillales bacterium]|nr:hypothetical protein [Rhodospirillales bacterium]